MKPEAREVGRRRPRLESRAALTGELQFAGDLRLPGMLHAKALLSTEHHAEIVALDTAEAAREPGVEAILTGDDVPVLSFPPGAAFRAPIAKHRVRYKGELVAVVAAEHEDAAEAAIRRIRVEYHPLPAVFDPREALEPGAPRIHDGGNLQKVYGDMECHQLRRGDVDAGFRESDLVVEGEYATSMVDTASIEPHVALARPDTTGRVTIWTSCQSIFIVARAVSEVLGIPMSKIRLIAPAVGGGFGGKVEATLEPIVGLLARRTHRPVRWALTVPEELAYSTAMHPYFMRIKTGVRRDGTFLARKMHFLLDCGAYCAAGILVAAKSCYIGAGTYRFPHQWADVSIVHTNRNPGGAFRGMGITSPTFAGESQIDEIAEKLGMDPLEIRLKNAYVEGDVTGTGQRLQAVGATQVIKRVAEMAGWEARQGP